MPAPDPLLDVGVVLSGPGVNRGYSPGHSPRSAGPVYGSGCA